jgi:pyruvate dehydrogenase E1 component alpha subunit
MTNDILVSMTLGDLADPTKYQSSIDIDGVDPEILVSQLRTMKVIRRAEEKLADMVVEGKVICPCHLGIGQEAIAVGVTERLRSSDRVFGTHRSHSHFLAMGGKLESLFGEVLGKANGCSGGMGGSMHLYDDSIGFKGSVPIVAATVSLAVGAALAASMDKTQDYDIGVAYFGDGAIEEGSVHESMNFAGRFRLPMLFVVENNLFSSHLHINHRQPADSVARFAAVNKLNYEVVDGNDVVAVSAATARLVDAARNGGGAGFLEAVTYRWRGHVGPSEDNDVGLKRSSDLQIWKKRDPIGRLADSLRHVAGVSEESIAALDEEVDEEIERAWKVADAAPYPDEGDLFAHLLSQGCN